MARRSDHLSLAIFCGLVWLGFRFTALGIAALRPHLTLLLMLAPFPPLAIIAFSAYKNGFSSIRNFMRGLAIAIALIIYALVFVFFVLVRYGGILGLVAIFAVLVSMKGNNQAKVGTLLTGVLYYYYHGDPTATPAENESAHSLDERVLSWVDTPPWPLDAFGAVWQALHGCVTECAIHAYSFPASESDHSTPLIRLTERMSDALLSLKSHVPSQGHWLRDTWIVAAPGLIITGVALVSLLKSAFSRLGLWSLLSRSAPFLCRLAAAIMSICLSMLASLLVDHTYTTHLQHDQFLRGAVAALLLPVFLVLASRCANFAYLGRLHERGARSLWNLLISLEAFQLGAAFILTGRHLKPSERDPPLGPKWFSVKRLTLALHSVLRIRGKETGNQVVGPDMCATAFTHTGVLLAWYAVSCMACAMESRVLARVVAAPLDLLKWSVTLLSKFLGLACTWLWRILALTASRASRLLHEVLRVLHKLLVFFGTLVFCTGRVASSMAHYVAVCTWRRRGIVLGYALLHAGVLAVIALNEDAAHYGNALSQCACAINAVAHDVWRSGPAPNPLTHLVTALHRHAMPCGALSVGWLASALAILGGLEASLGRHWQIEWLRQLLSGPAKAFIKQALAPPPHARLFQSIIVGAIALFVLRCQALASPLSALGWASIYPSPSSSALRNPQSIALETQFKVWPWGLEIAIGLAAGRFACVTFIEVVMDVPWLHDAAAAVLSKLAHFRALSLGAICDLVVCCRACVVALCSLVESAVAMASVYVLDIADGARRLAARNLKLGLAAGLLHLDAFVIPWHNDFGISLLSAALAVSVHTICKLYAAELVARNFALPVGQGLVSAPSAVAAKYFREACCSLIRFLRVFISTTARLVLLPVARRVAQMFRFVQHHTIVAHSWLTHVVCTAIASIVRLVLLPFVRRVGWARRRLRRQVGAVRVVIFRFLHQTGRAVVRLVLMPAGRLISHRWPLVSCVAAVASAYLFFDALLFHVLSGRWLDALAAALALAVSTSGAMFLNGWWFGWLRLQRLGELGVIACDFGTVWAARCMLNACQAGANAVLAVLRNGTRALFRIAGESIGLLLAFLQSVMRKLKVSVASLLAPVLRFVRLLIRATIVHGLKAVWGNAVLSLMASAILLSAAFHLHSSGAWWRLQEKLGAHASSAITVAMAVVDRGCEWGLALLTANAGVAFNLFAAPSRVLNSGLLPHAGAASKAVIAAAHLSDSQGLHKQRTFGLVVWVTFALSSRSRANLNSGDRRAIAPRALAAIQLALVLLFNAIARRYIILTLVLASAYLRAQAVVEEASRRETRAVLVQLERMHRERHRARTDESRADGPRSKAPTMEFSKPTRVFSTCDCVICMDPLSQPELSWGGDRNANSPEEVPRSDTERSASEKGIRSGLETVALRCGHQYHRDCIAEWLQSSNGQRRCPTCRQPVTLRLALIEGLFLVE